MKILQINKYLKNKGGSETIPSRDWDLAEIWYATSTDGFVWEEQGVAVPHMEKPHAGWRSVYKFSSCQ